HVQVVVRAHVVNQLEQTDDVRLPLTTMLGVAVAAERPLAGQLLPFDALPRRPAAPRECSHIRGCDVLPSSLEPLRFTLTRNDHEASNSAKRVSMFSRCSVNSTRCRMSRTRSFAR